VTGGRGKNRGRQGGGHRRKWGGAGMAEFRVGFHTGAHGKVCNIEAMEISAIYGILSGPRGISNVRPPRANARGGRGAPGSGRETAVLFCGSNHSGFCGRDPQNSSSPVNKILGGPFRKKTVWIWRGKPNPYLPGHGGRDFWK